MFQLYMLTIILILPTLIMTIAYSAISKKLLNLSSSKQSINRCSLQTNISKFLQNSILVKIQEHTPVKKLRIWPKQVQLQIRKK